MFEERLFMPSLRVRSGPAQMFGEFVATCGLLAVIWGCSRRRRGDECRTFPVQTDHWPLEDPKGKPLEKVREIPDQMRPRVQAVIDSEGEYLALIGSEK
jgi:hypothetical protein